MTFDPTTVDFDRGYWVYRPEDKFPPTAMFNLDSSFTNKKLCLAGTPESASLSEYQQRKTIQSWTETLPKLQAVETLWVAPKVNQSLFDAICDMPNLKGLHLKHTSIKHIDASALQGLKYLHLGSSPKLEAIDTLSEIKSLEWLDTENLKGITNFSPISNLTSLIGLGINGSMWTTQLIDSLRPLEVLQRLKYVQLTNARVGDGSLRPLRKLKNLKTVHLAKWFAQKEVDALHQAHPNLNYY